MTTTWLIVARAVHIGACLLFFGIFAFDRSVAAAIFTGAKTEAADYWQSCLRFFTLILLPVILLSGMFWFALVAMTMSGQPLQFEILKTVWTQTQFGTVCQLRLCLWLAIPAVTVLSWFFRVPLARQNISRWLQLFLGGALLGSLAWAGHGQESSLWHLAADILHLVVAGLWPAGLLPFLLLLKKLRDASEPSRWNLTAALVRRFSTISLGSVALLTITGFINAWFLVGSFSNLFRHAYGQWLMVKIILFCVSVAIGAVNLLRLKPRLVNEGISYEDSRRITIQLQKNIRAELVIGFIVLIVVAILGILPPANE